MKLLIATSNAGKLTEFQGLAGPSFELVSFAAFPSLVSPEVVEDGETYYENALKKALAYQQTYKMPVLADDSGLEVAALGGAPGVRSARLGGESIAWEARWAELHRLLAPFPEAQWHAAFRCVLCYYDGVEVPRFFEGVVGGKILPVAVGNLGFGYDPIFHCTSLGKSFGEIPKSEKALLSHRAQATTKFLEWFTGLDHASRHV